MEETEIRELKRHAERPAAQYQPPADWWFTCFGLALIACIAMICLLAFGQQ